MSDFLRAANCTDPAIRKMLLKQGTEKLDKQVVAGGWKRFAELKLAFANGAAELAQDPRQFREAVHQKLSNQRQQLNRLSVDDTRQVRKLRHEIALTEQQIRDLPPDDNGR